MKTKKFKGYPANFWAVLMVTAFTVTVSGLLMIPTFLEFKLDWDVIWRLDSGQRLATAALHVLGGLFLLILMGALWQTHMRAGWHKKQNHYSGAIMTASLCFLGATGIGLYYLGGELSQLVAAISHSIFGILFSLIFVWHGWRGASIRAAKKANKSNSNRVQARDATI